MMEVKQSPTTGLEFKDHSQMKSNGILESDSESNDIEPIETLCVSESDNEEDIQHKSESEKEKQEPKETIVNDKSNMESEITPEDLLNTLEKEDVTVEDGLAKLDTKTDNIDTADIDLFAEEFLNEIAESSKSNDSANILAKEASNSVSKDDLVEKSKKEGVKVSEKKDDKMEVDDDADVPDSNTASQPKSSENKSDVDKKLDDQLEDDKMDDEKEEVDPLEKELVEDDGIVDEIMEEDKLDDIEGEKEKEEEENHIDTKNVDDGEKDSQDDEDVKISESKSETSKKSDDKEVASETKKSGNNVIIIEDDKSQNNAINKPNENEKENDVDMLLHQLSEAIGEEAHLPEKDKKNTSSKPIDCDVISLDSPAVSVDEGDSKVDKIIENGNNDKEEEEEKEKGDSEVDDSKRRSSEDKKEDGFDSEDDDVVLVDLVDKGSGAGESDKTEKENNSSKSDKKEDTKKAEDADSDDDVVLVEENETKTLKDEDKNEKEKKDIVLSDDEATKNDENDKKSSVNSDSNTEEEIFSVNTNFSEKNILKKVDEVDDDIVLLENSDEKISELDEKKDDEKKSETESKEAESASDKGQVGKVSDDSTQVQVQKNEKLVSDNSDNAQDKFPDESMPQSQGSANDESSTNEEDNNLLKEVSSPQNSNDGGYEAEKSKQSEGDNSESEEPPSKKFKSTDDVSIKDDDIEVQDNSTTEKTEDIKATESLSEKDESIKEEKSLKRSLSPEPELQEAKKLKVSNDTSAILDNLKQEKKPKVSKKPKVDLNLDFFKRFKKSISKMTKNDLEELVIQKVVEAIVHRSEFSEMRDLIEKQEKMITSHRTKITELTKQFRDLEMVHNRVLKDLEIKNQQFIMPVKITRAVGLQVLIPKRSEQVGSKLSSNNLSNAPTTSTPNTSTASSANTTPITNGDLPVRRSRCAQKITPLRPDTPQHSPINKVNTSSSNTPVSMKQQLILQQQEMQSTPGSRCKVVYKSVNAGSQPSTPVQQHQTLNGAIGQVQQVQIIPPNSSVAQINTTNRKSMAANRNNQQQTASVQQKTPPLSAQMQPDRPRVPPMILKKSGANGRCLTVANPTAVSAQVSTSSATTEGTSKSVIDLTDEDDKAPAGEPNLPALVAIPQQKAASIQQQNRVTTYVVNKPNSASQRVTVQNVKNGNQYRQTCDPLSKSQASLNKSTVKIAPKPAQPTPGLTAINAPRVQNTPPASSRRNIHPAPLPKAPQFVSNATWKASPPRPTIRINNIESGIVISWTMDDMTDLHAEVTSYQIYAYQETSAPPQVEAWRHVGDVKAMLLPMAVTLTQFLEGQRYFFAVRAVDTHGRYGPFSMPKTWA